MTEDRNLNDHLAYPRIKEKDMTEDRAKYHVNLAKDREEVRRIIPDTGEHNESGEAMASHIRSTLLGEGIEHLPPPIEKVDARDEGERKYHVNLAKVPEADIPPRTFTVDRYADSKEVVLLNEDTILLTRSEALLKEILVQLKELNAELARTRYYRLGR